jgi:hypothetical protein
MYVLWIYDDRFDPDAKRVIYIPDIRLSHILNIIAKLIENWQLEANSPSIETTITCITV